MMRKTTQVLIVNQIEGSQTGGFTYEDKGPTYVRTLAPTYLRSHFYHTFCAEPVNCLQISASLRAAGLDTAVLDGLLGNMNKHDLTEELLSWQARIYLFSIFHSSYFPVIDIIRAVKESEPRATVVLGGNYATLVYRQLLERNPEIDYVLVGEADDSAPALCKAILSGGDPTRVEGVAYREAKGRETTLPCRVVLTPARIPEIESVQPLSRDFADEVLAHEFSFSLHSSRGCGLGVCTFCYLPEYQKISNIPRWRGKSPEKIVAEIEDLKARYGIRHVTFVDEDFIGPKGVGTDRVVAFAKLLVERQVNVTWYANCLVVSVFALIRAGHLPLLAESGLRYLFVGIEAGSDHILRRFKKGFTVQGLRNAVAELEKYQIKINPGLITFLPESTPAEVRANIDLVRLIDYYDIFVFTRRLVLLPGTEEGCGCAATGADVERSAEWDLPDEEYRRALAIDVKIDPEVYFQHPGTRLLYHGMCDYRDRLYPIYTDLTRDHIDIGDGARRELSDQHFRFFYDLYERVEDGRVCSYRQVQAFVDQRIEFAQVAAERIKRACVPAGPRLVRPGVRFEEALS